RHSTNRESLSLWWRSRTFSKSTSVPCVTVPTSSTERLSAQRSGDAHLVGARTNTSTVVEFGDSRHVVVGEVEIAHVEVLGNTCGRHRLRNDDVTHLKMPPQHHLCRSLTVFRGQTRQRLVRQQPALRQWTPRLGGNVVFRMEAS